MKVTALIPDQVINEVVRLAQGKTVTESLFTALKEWIALKKLTKLNASIKSAPLGFKKGFTAFGVREKNRKR
ncbi:MAG: DUF2191 domain-containing protein [Deltaproteobacteria bacterium]|nr:DUF2191 domain-containing protein [Deltaproteobacteria bacterium]